MRWYSLVLFLLIVPASALVIPDIELDVQMNSSLVEINEPLRVDVVLTNKEAYESRYILLVSGQYPQWIVNYNYTGLIEPHGTLTVPVIIVPSEPGSYEYTAELRSENIKTTERTMIFTVKDVELPVEQRNLEISIPKSAVPGARIDVKVTATGFTPEEAELLLYRNNQEVKRALVQVNKRDTVVTFVLPEVMLAGDYRLTMRSGAVFDSVEFSVPEVRKVDRSRSLENTLFGRSVTLIIKNNGNIISEGEVSETILWYERFFTRFEQTPREVNSQVIWNYQLNPGQKTEFSYHISFLPLVLFIIIVIMIIAYFAQESTLLSVEKTATKKENKIDVVITIKNISDGGIGSIKLTDLIPPFSKAKFTDDPDAKLKTTEGLVCSWSKGRLKPGETLEIKYALKILETIGRVHLPKCQVDFLLPDGKTKNTFSLSPYV
jgi:hypothetical protein